MIVDVVGVVVNFTDGEEMIKLFYEIIPIHIENTVVGIFVISELHAFLFLRVHQIPARIVIIPSDLGLLCRPRVANLHKFYSLSILESGLIDT